MKNKIFGALAVASLVLSSAAMAEGKKAAAGAKKHDAKKAEGWCKSNECKGQVTGSKNECKGKMACKGMDQAKCEVDQKGTWSTEPAPK